MDQPEKYTVKGQPLSCQHCGHDHFDHKRILLNTRGMTYLRLDWLNADADVFVCARCGYLMWFARDPASEPEAVAQPITCLSCGTTIPTNAITCPKCGWSYKKPAESLDLP